MSPVTRTRGTSLGPSTRPVAIPDDFGDANTPRARGKVTLPLWVRWSGPNLTFDLDDPDQRARVYEIVLQEGTEDDVRWFVDPDELASSWDRLVLPPWVRRAWAEWYRSHRAVHLTC